MRIVFDPHQPHQHEAIAAVVDLFDASELEAPSDRADAPWPVVANRLPLRFETLDARVRAHQGSRGLRVDGLAIERAEVVGRDGVAGPLEVPGLTIEMETGTGKTYVFLRTALELARRAGLRKFVVVVPSIAIREGVLATLRSTRAHFAALYPELLLSFFRVERGRWAPVVRFARGTGVEIAVITIDAFNRDRNLFRQPQDRCGGRSPLQLWQLVRPVVILDEAHHMQTRVRLQALADLAPCLALRYSATPRERAGLVHRLGAAEAHRRGLVKTIEVVPSPAPSCASVEERFSAQLEAMVAAHVQRQRELWAAGIKVLSLVFLERVADYLDDGLVARLFDRHFEALKGEHPPFANVEARSVRAAYFARRRDGAADTRGSSEADRDAFDLILRDKERLLAFAEPVAFVFSHSALREGWDNPNVFQICTLARSYSELKQRQEIGRGIRLCVDQRGLRVFDPAVNVLQVFANDTYERYVASLQAEDEARGGRPTIVREGTATRRTNSPVSMTSPARARCVPSERLARARALTRGALPPFTEGSSRATRPLPNLVDAVLTALGEDPPGGPVSRASVLSLLAEVERPWLTAAPARVAAAIAAALVAAADADPDTLRHGADQASDPAAPRR